MALDEPSTQSPCSEPVDSLANSCQYESELITSPAAIDPSAIQVVGTDRVFDETNRAVAKEDIDSARMAASRADEVASFDGELVHANC